MLQLRPGEQFPITYRISDPSDATTYYVQAKIYNSRTSTLLDTVNLVDQGNGVFRQNWQVTGDSSDQGLFIDVNINVYTNSGYSVTSTNYQQENRQYLVQERVNTHRFGVGPGGDVDYKKIKKMIDEAISNVASNLNYSEKLTEIYDCVEEVKAETKGLKEITNMDKTSAINGRLDKLDNSIDSLSENLRVEIQGSAQSFDGLKEQVLTGFENLTNTISRMPTVEGVKEEVRELNDNIAKIPEEVRQLKDSVSKIPEIVEPILNIPNVIQSIPDKVDEMKQGLSDMAGALLQVETITIQKGVPVSTTKKEGSKEQMTEQKDFSTIAKLLSQ